MVLTAIKKYPSQITSAFKRFPLASAMAFFTFCAFAMIYELGPTLSNDATKPFLWLGIYPVAAMLIAIATSLFRESNKSTSHNPQIITSSAWLAISITLVSFLFAETDQNLFYFTSTIILIYIVAIFSIFFAPFWKQKDENGFWNFLQKNIKALITAVLISAILLGAIEGLVFGFAGLFDADFSENVYFYIFLFCSCTVLPILYFTGIPSIDECLEETPSLNKFATSTIRFLFIPVLAIGIILFYAYTIKFIALWNMPEGVVSAFVSGFMVYMLVLVTVMYPAHLAPNNTIEKRLLKIFPAACIPLVVLMTVDIIIMLLNSDIDEEFFYIIAINIYFYAVIAIWLIDKINLKFRYIALTFCVLFLICTDSPLSAPKITRHIWANSIEKTLIEQGYSKFPLSEEDEKKFIEALKKSDNKDAKNIFLRIQKLDNEYLAPYFSEKISLFDEPESSSTVPDTTEKFETFKANINNTNKNSLKIPKGVKQAFFIDLNFDNDDFKYNGDTLSFLISITEDQDTSIHSTYDFRITKQELQIDSLNTIETDSAIIGIRELHTEQWSKTGQSLRIDGLLFIK